MSRTVDLVLADVDGTLVTNDRHLTEVTRRVVGALRHSGSRLVPAGIDALSRIPESSRERIVLGRWT